MRRVALGIAVLTAGACADPTGPRADPEPTPVIAREMRGVWIATVANIDWPTRKDLTADQQRAELTDLLDRAATGGFNAVIFHVRPAGDAVYASALEPWASLLTGTQGVSPGYDPLAFAVQEAHARGLELHAWINPFRGGRASDTSVFSPLHVFRARRDLMRVYGTDVWMDPGEQEIHDRSMRAILDIVDRYDIDGIHADDYFYPYQVRNAANQIVGFPDTATYTRSGSALSIDNWRRENIDRFVERMYREVHQRKPTLKVGLSPFGIWR
ncbi:MAG: family 10 glycosylhydrolase, partial [Gemmatimonadaceae bacterium]